MAKDSAESTEPQGRDGVERGEWSDRPKTPGRAGQGDLVKGTWPDSATRRKARKGK